MIQNEQIELDEPVKYGINLKSIQFKTWLYFFLMTAVVLGCLWLVQILFFKSYYDSMRKRDVERVGDDVAGEFPGRTGDKAFSEFLMKTAYANGLNIIVFTMTFDVGVNGERLPVFNADYFSSQFNAGVLPDDGLISTDDPRIIEGWDKFYPEIISCDRFVYKAESVRGAYLVYGAQLQGDSYIYISSPLLPMDATAMVLKNQLIIVTLICMIFSLILSWFVSNRISKPITEFSLSAQKLAKGDYKVKFVGNGYTEIEDLAQTLNYATEEMGKTEALRRDFLANVSHDLRTPLTMVKAYAEMIRDISGGNSEKRTEHSQVIIDEADRLTNLVNDILNLSKLQSGTEENKLEPIDLSNLASMVVERFDIYSTKSGYVFKVDLDDNCMVSGDSKRLEQVLYNLISNAVNYTGEDKTVVIHVKKINGKIAVGITDSGKGIAPQELDSVWERYYRASTTRREVVGNGLGLSIVKNILISHSAEYGVDSKLGFGTVFWFKLPDLNYVAPQEDSESLKKGRKAKK